MSKRKRPPQAQVLANRQRTQARLRDQAGRVTAASAAVAVEDHEDPPDTSPRSSSGVVTATGEHVKGSAFEWGEGLFYDVETGAYYDRGEYEARDYKDMLRVYHKARALDNVLTLPILMAEWKLVPGKGDTGECEDVEEKLRRPANNGGMTTPMRQIIGQMTSAFALRRAYFAKGFKLDTVADDGSVLYSQLAFRPQTTCRLLRDASDGSFKGFEQDLIWYAKPNRGKDEWQGKPIQFKPRESMVFLNGTHRDPIGGISDLEIAYWCWKTQQKLLFLWYDYLAGQALPRTLVAAKGDLEKAKAAATTIAKLKSSGVGYYDTEGIQDIHSLDVSGRGPDSFMAAIKYLDQSASGSVMASFTDLGAAADAGGGMRGSFALSKDQTDFFLQGRLAASHELEECLTNFMIADLVHYNYGPDGVVPQFQFLPLNAVDEQPIIGLLTALAAAPPGGPIPVELIGQLCVEAARLLSLDVDKIRSAVERGAQLAAKQAEQMAAAGGASQAGQHAASGAAALSSAAGTIKSIAQSNGHGAPQPAVGAAH